MNMDVSRFDSFTRALAEIISRRGILGAVGAGLSGIAALAGMGAGDPFGAEARRKRKRKGK